MIGIRAEGDLAALGEALSGMAEVDYVVTTAGSSTSSRRSSARTTTTCWTC